MLIAANTVVTFHYQASDAERGILEDSREISPVIYLHGHRSMLVGLEEALAGKQSGDQFSVTLPPERAYGPLHPNSQQRVSMKHVVNPAPKHAKFKPGMVIQINTERGAREVTVLKVGLKTTALPLFGLGSILPP